MWHRFYLLWMEPRPINLINYFKKSDLMNKSQNSFLIISMNLLILSAYRYKSIITTTVMMLHYQFHCLFIITICHFCAWKSVLFLFQHLEQNAVWHSFLPPLLFSQQVLSFICHHLSSLIPSFSLVSFHSLEWFGLHHAPSIQIWNASLEKGDTPTLSSLSLTSTVPYKGKPHISVF